MPTGSAVVGDMIEISKIMGTDYQCGNPVVGDKSFESDRGRQQSILLAYSSDR